VFATAVATEVLWATRLRIRSWQLTFTRRQVSLHSPRPTLRIASPPDVPEVHPAPDTLPRAA
jgi:hypothetical protein